MEDLKKFLLKVGVASDVITQLTDPPEDGADVEKLAKDFKASQRDVFKNDPEIVGELTGSLRGKERGSVERKIKKEFGITAEEWGENELEGDYAKAISFGINKLKTESNKPAEKLQTELQDANQKLKEYKEEIIPGIENKAQQKINQFYVRNRLHGLIEESGELIVTTDVANTVITNEFAKLGYKTEIDNDQLSIKTRDGLAPQDKDKTRNLSNSEVVKNILDTKGLIKQSKADPDPKPQQRTIKPSDPVEPNVNAPPGMAAALEHQKELESGEVKESGPKSIFRKE